MREHVELCKTIQSLFYIISMYLPSKVVVDLFAKMIFATIRVNTFSKRNKKTTNRNQCIKTEINREVLTGLSQELTLKSHTEQIQL